LRSSILRFIPGKRKIGLYGKNADGIKLVEVDRKLLENLKKISDRELQQWVKNNAEKN
jgi:hypothetical protein